MLSKLGFNSQDYIPKTLTCFWEGYTFKTLYHDLLAGITVGVIALPLAMAFAIGSGVPPERGLFTAVVAGFLISLLGGSRVQIGGPTGAFVIIVSNVIERHGYDGLAIATLIAGVIMILMGLVRCGVLLKFIPYPVTTGFTAGIAVVIFSSQIKDFLGLSLQHVPSGFIEQWQHYLCNCLSMNVWALGIGAFTLVLIILLRNFFPRAPGAIIALALAGAAVYYFQIPVDTVFTRFGELPRTLPTPSIPDFSIEKIQEVFPDAVSIALLGAIESLLSAVVADGITGHRHRSNGELVAQGVSNLGSIFFGGIPATGAIARTMANIRLGAKTPVSGMIHAITVFLLMFCFAPLAGMVPMASLAGLLIFIAWNMSERQHFWEILRGDRFDAVVLLLTFFLTILIDLTVAVQVGVLLAAILFLKRMSDRTTVEACSLVVKEEEQTRPEFNDADFIYKHEVPSDVTIFEINGPLFFGVADSLNETLRVLDRIPRVFILRMRKVTMIDSTGVRALKQFADRCQQKEIKFLLSGVNADMLQLLENRSVVSHVGKENVFPHINGALAYAKMENTI